MLRKLETFTKATHTPVGFLFLQEPTKDWISTPVFCTTTDEPISRASPDLLDTLYPHCRSSHWADQKK